MKNNYENRLLEEWESVFQQGLLTFWLFVVIRNKKLSTAEIRLAIEKLTNGTYSAAEQSLYRLLRKQYVLETVDYNEVKVKGAPNRKLYTLTPIGKRLLQRFMERNISLFLQPEVRNLIIRGDNK